MRVVVQRIESMKDSSGILGKRVELVEESFVPSYAIKPPSEEAQMVQDVFRTLQQQMPFLNVKSQFSSPKLILFFTDQEYEQLDVIFEVNQTYEIILSSKKIEFRKIT